MKKQSKPLLSIGMIVKNEAEHLPRCLAALAPLRAAIPCELVIADTGSEDATREIAAQYADIFFDFPWCNDFSAARNAVMDRCTGRWFLSVDADEYLDPDFSELPAFLTGTKSRGRQAGLVVIRNYLTANMVKESSSDFFALRLLRLSTGLRYQGSIHESWPMDYTSAVATLQKVVFHHNGYVAKTKEDQKQKNIRNLSLLEKELEKDSESLRRVVQCLESSYTQEQEMKYAAMAARLAEKPGDDPEYWRALALRDAVSSALKYRRPELDDWAAKARELFPESIYTCVDVSFCCAYCHMDDPERCRQELDRYWAGITRYQLGQYDASALLVGVLQHAKEQSQQDARLMEVQSYADLGMWEQAAGALENLHLENAEDGQRIQNFVGLLLRIWRNSDTDLVPLLRREWQSLDADRESDNAKQRRETFLALCRNAFRKSGDETMRPASGLFAALGDGCDLGRAGLIVSSNSAEEATDLLASVEEWEALPPEALDRALALGASLPDCFYRLKAEILEYLAGGLASIRRNRTEETLRLLTPEDGGALSPGQVMWQFLLACSAVKAADWESAGSPALFDRFCSRTEDYLQTFCNLAVCTEEWIDLLPPMVRFGWHCQKARRTQETGDLVGYLRELRTGLSSCPAMKEMVSFLLETERAAAAPAVSEELMALAEKVRAILSQYSPDDPAVAQLKASPAYQMVAPLIDLAEQNPAGGLLQ